jgi:predicted TIM-barrel fold metal-dependent hydrolase
MDKAGVDGAIIVPPSWEGDRNDLANEAARAHPTRFATMGRFDPEAPGATGQLADWKKQPGMLGVRFTFHTEVLRQPLLDGRFDWVWGELEKRGIPAMVLFHHEYMHLADKVAERYPGLRLVLDHLGLKSGKGVTEAMNFATLDNVLALARRPNVAAKVSAMPCYAADKTYPFKSVHPHIRRVFDAFGPKRTFWGTDLSRLPCSYRQGVTMFTEEMPWLKGSDLEDVMGRGVCEWLGWKL